MWIEPKPLDRYPLFLRPFFWNQKRKYGQVLKPGLLWGRSPWLFATVAMLYGALDRRRSPISAELRSLLTVRVSQINWCRFCVDINSATFAQRAGSLDKILALSAWRESSLFSKPEIIALEYTEAMTYSDREVTAVHMAAMKSVFKDDEIIEITGLIAFQNMSSKFNSALDVPAEGFCEVPLPERDSKVQDLQ